MIDLVVGGLLGLLVVSKPLYYRLKLTHILLTFRGDDVAARAVLNSVNRVQGYEARGLYRAYERLYAPLLECYLRSGCTHRGVRELVLYRVTELILLLVFGDSETEPSAMIILLVLSSTVVI